MPQDLLAITNFQMCLAALIVILAYLGIKYRDGIKSLAKRIEHWSNVRNSCSILYSAAGAILNNPQFQPNRNGYANLGGDVHSASDWRNDTDAILRGDWQQ